MTKTITAERAAEIAEYLTAASDDPDTATTMMVRIVDFKKGLRYARRFRGVFVPELKLWRLTFPIAGGSDRNHMRAAGMYGLRIVREDDRVRLAAELSA